MLVERREDAGDEGGIKRIAGRLVQPVVESASYRADRRYFEMTTEGQVARCHEQLCVCKMSISRLILCARGVASF